MNGGKDQKRGGRHLWGSLCLTVVAIGVIAMAMSDEDGGSSDAATQAPETSALTNTATRAEPTSAPSQQQTNTDGGSAVNDAAADTQPA